MAIGKKRTLDAERYPGPDEQVVDAEEIQSFSTRMRGAGSYVREQARKTYQNRQERKANSPRGQRKKYAREQARRTRQTRKDAAGPDSDPRARLKLQMQVEQSKFLRHLRTSGITSQEESKPSQRRKLSDLHQAYAARMVLHCLDPLQRGISAQNVLSTVAMGTAMWLLSPNFRTHVGDYGTQMATAIGDKLDWNARREAKITAQGEKSLKKEAQHFDKTGQGREGMRGLSGRRHRNRLDRLERMKRGDRDLFTYHSAALTHVGIAQNAYDEMRRPGANRELVKKNYQSALSALYGYVKNDGLERSGVARNMRFIVGQLIERDPEQAAVFSELGHGQLNKTEPQPVVLEGTTDKRMAWTGDYVDVYNGNVVTGGTFTLREPMDTDEHRAAVARTVYGELSSAKSPDEFSKALEQYIIGSITRQYPEAVELNEDAQARARMSRSRVMFASMRDDELNDQDQKLVYMGGVFESIRALERTHPDMVKLWSRSLGPEWEERMRDLIKKYSEFGEDAEQRSTQHNSPSGNRERGPTPQPPAAKAAPIEEATMHERNEMCHRVGLVDENGNINEKRLSEMEAKGVSLKRAERTNGDWFIDGALLATHDSKKLHATLLEEMSDHMANDLLNTVQLNEGENLSRKLWPIVRVWRNGVTELNLRDSGALLTNSAPRKSRRAWGKDEASNTREREIRGMFFSMRSLTFQEQNRLYSSAYVRALDKVMSTDPSCKKFVIDLVVQNGGNYQNWRQCEYEAALGLGHGNQRTRQNVSKKQDDDKILTGKSTSPNSAPSAATGKQESEPEFGR